MLKLPCAVLRCYICAILCAACIFKLLLCSLAPQYQAVLPAIADTCVAVTAQGEGPPRKGAEMLELLQERSQFGSPDVSHASRRHETATQSHRNRFVRLPPMIEST